MRRSANRPCIRNRATMAIPRPEERHRFPSFGHRYSVLSKRLFGAIHRSWLCALQLSISLILDLIARLQVHHHAPTCTYHLLSFLICPLDIALSHCFSACSDDARLSRRRIHRRYRCVNLRLSFSFSLNTTRCPRLYVHGGRQDQASRRAS